MRHVSTFSGIGGFDLAFGTTSAWVEVDPKCQELLRSKFPEAQGFDDIRQVTGADLGHVDVLTGGFPCQDISIAGKRAGLAGQRSGLFWEFARLLEETQPEWFVLENVAGLLSSGGGRDLGAIIGSLVDIGYGIAYRVLDAQFFGVPQRRRRVFIVGRSGGRSDSAREVLLEPNGLSRNLATGREEGEVVAALTRSGLGGGGPDDNLAQAGHLQPVSTLARGGPSQLDDNAVGQLQPLAFVNQGGDTNLGLSENQAPPVTASHGNPGMVLQEEYAVRKLMPVECERLQGFPDGWTEGFADTTRYRMLGNAVAVPVVRWLADRVKAAA